MLFATYVITITIIIIIHINEELMTWWRAMLSVIISTFTFSRIWKNEAFSLFTEMKHVHTYVRTHVMIWLQSFFQFVIWQWSFDCLLPVLVFSLKMKDIILKLYIILTFNQWNPSNRRVIEWLSNRLQVSTCTVRNILNANPWKKLLLPYSTVQYSTVQ